MYIDLIQKLSEDDKKRITNYIKLYGTTDFIGVDKWLQSWSHANQKLYKLLGNSFIYKEKVSIQKPDNFVVNEITRFIHKYDSPFLHCLFRLHEIYSDFSELPENANWKTENNAELCSLLKLLRNMTNSDIWIKDVIDDNIKIKGVNKKKMLQISKGMKPIRAAQKIMNFIKEETLNSSSFKFNWEKVYKEFDEFRIKLSMITNDKFISGNLCFSIHPLDFMTMSDNNYDWSSCMSWRNQGCYHLGTVEMMNSNNVICCYLEGKEPFFFDEPGNEEIAKAIQQDEYSKDLNTWNNKKWRTLCYINKNIIMSGKSYPYQNGDLSKKVIEIAKRLAGDNVNWFYDFGPELYKDMQHIYSGIAMDNNKRWIKNKNTIKHNIIWDTKAMYNDMLNDRSCHYWCYRNKVKHNIVYSVSGKAPCLCCGEEVSVWADEEDYNERYLNVESVVCTSCRKPCDLCENYFDLIRYYTLEYPDGKQFQLCENCFRNIYRICPGCGEPYLIDLDCTDERKFVYYAELERGEAPVYYDAPKISLSSPPEEQYALTSCQEPDSNLHFLKVSKNSATPILERLYMCKNCYAKISNTVDLKEINIKKCFYYINVNKRPRLITSQTGEQCEKFFLRNQKILTRAEAISYLNKTILVNKSYDVDIEAHKILAPISKI